MSSSHALSRSRSRASGTGSSGPTGVCFTPETVGGANTRFASHRATPSGRTAERGSHNGRRETRWVQSSGSWRRTNCCISRCATLALCV